MTQPLLLLLRFSVTTSLALSTSSFAREPRSGTIKRVQGEAVVVQQDAVRTVATPNTAVSPRNRIVTAPDASAALSLRDGTSIVIGPNSTVHLSRFTFDSTRQEGSMALDLIRRSLRFISGLIARANPDRVKISTATFTIGIRGTNFIVEYV